MLIFRLRIPSTWILVKKSHIALLASFASERNFRSQRAPDEEVLAKSNAASVSLQACL